MTISFVENICDHDSLFDECPQMLPKVRPNAAQGKTRTLPRVRMIPITIPLNIVLLFPLQAVSSSSDCGPTVPSPQDMLALGVIPVLRAVHPEYYDVFLSLARDRLGIEWQPPTSTSTRGGVQWAKLLERLQERRDRCHPEVDMTVLAYLEPECNVE